MIFSDSNQYVQNTEVLQSALGFVSAMDIDIYVKRSFSTSRNAMTLSGGFIASFTKDHLIDEQFLYYHIQPDAAHKLLNSAGAITCTLEGKGSFVLNLLQGFLQGTPVIALLIISLSMLFLPAAIAKVVRRISVIGIIITYMFYAWKIGRLLYRAVTNKGIDYKGLNVVYEQESDFALINQEQFAAIKTFQEETAVSKLVFFQGGIHLKQPLHKPSFRRSIWAFLIPHEEIPASYDQRTHETTEKLLSASFIGLTPTAPNA